MENPPATAVVTRELCEKHRVVLLGGLAMISHGHARPTYDADIWLDPMLEPLAWARAVVGLSEAHPALHPVSIGKWLAIPASDLPSVIERDGAIRVMGADQPLDIFRAPNELDIAEFDEIWERGVRLEDGTRLPDVIDLLVSKQDTGRDKDIQDMAFLEAKAERQYLKKLPVADEAEAVFMLGRFLTPRVAETALDHESREVRALATQYLVEMADEGNPFAKDILRNRKIAG